MPIGVRDMGSNTVKNLFLTIGMKSSYKAKKVCPECGKKNCAVFDDGHEHCFTMDCGYTYYPNKKEKKMTANIIPIKKTNPKLLPVKPMALPKRGITKETCELFGYGIAEYRGQPVQVATYKDQKGNDVAQHIRFQDKKFIWIGDMSNVMLWGQHLWRQHGGNGSVFISVFEGEVDCLSGSQIQGNKFPCVSIPSGVQSAAKYLAANYKWLDTFCRIVICFDNDVAGMKAADKCLEVLPKGKVAIAKLDRNDVNDHLVLNEEDIVRKKLWNARPSRPDSLINGADAWDLFIKETSKPISDFPFPKLNEYTQGIFPTQLFTVASGSGAGKSTICRELAYHFLVKRNLKIGYIGLEESVQRTLQGLVGIDLNIPLHLAAEETVDQDELKKSFDRLTSTRNLFLYNHFGSLEPDTLLEQIRYLATVDGVQIIILDHITIVTSGLDLDNERRAIDVTMTKLRSLCESTGIALILVSHLRRPQGQAHEEGREISTSDLKGSSGLLQLSDVVLGASRNQVGEASERQRLTLKILKSRHTGMTGEVDKLLYDQKTGRLEVYESIFGE
jgi:twinkle protein